jgi:hypothetical protein
MLSKVNWNGLFGWGITETRCKAPGFRYGDTKRVSVKEEFIFEIAFKSGILGSYFVSGQRASLASYHSPGESHDFLTIRLNRIEDNYGKLSSY